jgi:GTP-binding protein EngB required for normal cell division
VKLPALPSRRPDISDRLAALDEALAVAVPRLNGEQLQAAQAVRVKVDERLARGADAVVVALAGGTGTGKSSLFNALTGEPLSRAGPTRPVTSEPVAWAAGNPASASGLLDWLGVNRRHHTQPTAQLPEGLVVIDLPDDDSINAEHRVVSERFVERVDMLVWVVDPLKYAQRVLHQRDLRRLATHADVVVVVLNQIDRLSAEERRACEDDLRRLLREEGLGAARVLATSALTGAGVDDLRALLADEARRRRAIGNRLDADVRAAAAALAAETGPPVGSSVNGSELIAALGQAAGIDTLAFAARTSYRTEAKAATRPLLSRGVWAVVSRAGRPLRPRRPSTPDPRATAEGEVSPAGVRHALLRLAEDRSAQLPAGWRSHLRGTVRQVSDALPKAIARTVGDEPLFPDPRRWWFSVAVLWTIVELVTVTGLAWLVVLGVLAWLQLPVPEPPIALGVVPWPTALLLGGALVWLVIGFVRNRMVALGARRPRRRVVRRLRQRLLEVAERHALAPMRAELEAHDTLARALDRAAR